MPAKKTADASNAVGEAMTDAVKKAQEQYLAAVEQGQAMALEGYKGWLETMSTFEIPSVPGLTDIYKARTEAFEQLFEFSAAMLENQRSLTMQMFEAASGAQS